MFFRSAAHNHRKLLQLALTLIAPACGAIEDEQRYVAEVRFNAAGDVVVAAQGLVAAFDPDMNDRRFSFKHEPKGGLNERDQTLDVSTVGNVGAVALDDSVVVFNAETGKRILTLGPAALDVRSDLPVLMLTSLAVSPDGHFLAVVTSESDQPSPPSIYSSHMSVFRVATGERLWKKDARLSGTPYPFKSTSVQFLSPRFSEDSRRLAVEEYDRKEVEVSQMVAVETGVPELTLLPAGAHTPLFTPSTDHSILIGMASEPSTRSVFPAVWNAADGGLVQTYPELADTECVSTSSLIMAASPQGKLFATLSWDICAASPQAPPGTRSSHSLLIWNRQGQTIHRLPVGQVTSMAFSPDGSHLAVGEFFTASVYRMSDGVRLGSRSFDKKLF